MGSVDSELTGERGAEAEDDEVDGDQADDEGGLHGQVRSAPGQDHEDQQQQADEDGEDEDDGFHDCGLLGPAACSAEAAATGGVQGDDDEGEQERPDAE